MADGARGSDKRKHVVIVGAGAAGMSCAAALADHPERFKVTMIEAAGNCGGQATSISIDEKKHGASWMNDGVQGGSLIFRHTMRFFKKYGHEAKEVRLQVAFGKGPDSFWTNVFPSPLVERHQRDIKRFGTMLKWIKRLMPVLGLVPIRVMLRLFRFSQEFGNQMVYPLIALFLGTGNQTPNVASAILERLFDDPNMKLWDYDPDTLLPNLPTMITFPKLAEFYRDWEQDLRSKGVDIRLKTAVDTVVRRSGGAQGVVLRVHGWEAAENNDGGKVTTPASETEAFDELVLCTLADEAKRILGAQASWRERFVLGGAKFYDDMTVTHWDREYFDSVYETTYAAERCAAPQNDAQKQQVAFAKGEAKGPGGETPGFRPMYYTHTYADAPGKIEMSFDVTHYQHQFRSADGVPAGVVPSWDQHVFQSIFLDVNHRDRWTQDRISPNKVVAHKWWHQLGHRWQHYVRVVPLMPLLQGKRNTYFAGSWNLVNMHELACVSGLACAWRLGAPYVYFDDFAEDFFGKFLMLNHWKWYRPQSKKDKKNT